MVEIAIVADRARFEVQGVDKLWSFKSQLEIPLAHIVSVRADPEAASGWWHGFRLPGTSLPGVITAGTFYQHGEWVFYDVHDPERTIVIELAHERYKRLVVEVADPASAVAALQRAIAPR